MAAPRIAYAVEFIGGPLDGRVDLCTAPPHPFLGLVLNTGRSRRSILRRLLGTFADTKPVPSRLAIYELDEDQNTCRYRYLRTQLFTEECELSESVYLTDVTT
ncbi:MAG: hypothetical protein JJ992_05130 [Planctomycetes bacterium]|nr:hypothetical protein [Planctomycetota bacterium]